MKLLYLLIASLTLTTLLSSCNTKVQNESYFLGKMNGEWRLNRITNLDNNTYQVGLDLHLPTISIHKNTFDWEEEYYSGTSSIHISSHSIGTGEFEYLEDEEGNTTCEEIFETVYSTNLNFMYKRYNAESLILDPGKDSLSRSLIVTRIDLENSNMIWQVLENGTNFEFHFSKIP